MGYTLRETETNAPEYKHEESFDNLESAQKRMLEMYRGVAIDGNPDAIEKAEHFERSAYVLLNDGNQIEWDIEEN